MLRRCSTLHLIPVRRYYASSAPGKPLIDSSTISRLQQAKSLKRIHKAERDERIGRTSALTSVRTYTGGFARPTALRASSWTAGGANSSSGKNDAQPSPFTHEPHTVFLLESRHDVRYGVGKVDHVEHIVGVCRAEDFEEVVNLYNSKYAPFSSFQAMDNARWPWVSQQKARSVKWYNAKQELQEVSLDSSIPNSFPEVIVSSNSASARAPQDSWVRPGDSIAATEKDVERKGVQTNAVKHRVSEENLDNIIIELKSRQGKVPFEVELDDGTVEHPSGFVPPTAADKFSDHSSVGSNAPPAAPYQPRRSSVTEDTHSDAVPGISQWQAIKAREAEQGQLMPHLTEGILSGGVTAAMKHRDEKIPTEVYGVNEGGEVQPMQHPSGFIPPTPKMARGEHEARTATVSARHAQHLPVPNDVKELRSQYLPKIKNEPFWRPLLSFTVSTRPLANTIARLSRGQSKGVSFDASIAEVDKKSKTSYGASMRDLRLKRMQSLVVDLSKALAGDRGGLVGMRFSKAESEGNDAAAPIPWEKRVIGVSVGDWYPHAEELKQAFRDAAGGNQDQHPFIVYDMNEWGKPVEGQDVKLPWSGMVHVTPEIQEAKKVLRSIRELEHALDVDTREHSTSSLRVITPSLQTTPDAVSNPDVSVVVLLPEDPLPSNFDPKVNGILEGPIARDALKARVERLYASQGDAIAELFASRSKQVTYPYFWAEEVSVPRDEENIVVEEHDGGRTDTDGQKQQ
ncbi:hypothetical protein VNI00_015278 [Paramarasmius palmivorus]|uniref:Uncharacterized protein n=1 Tax=Paramarasmius palmivorus TaxID=297713 RepID=A0AAW0BLN7_9AGAR